VLIRNILALVWLASFPSPSMMDRTFDSSIRGYRLLTRLRLGFRIDSNSLGLKILSHISCCERNCILPLPIDGPYKSFSSYFGDEIYLLYPPPNNIQPLLAMDQTHFFPHQLDLTIEDRIVLHCEECLELD
jgi:hypothetical protein